MPKKALLWPVNLGSGKPYNPDERMENFILAYCSEKLGREADTDTFYSRVSDYKLSNRSMDNSLLYLQVLSLENTGSTEAAQKLLEKAINDYPDSKYIKWITDYKKQKVSASNSTEMIRLEKQESPINNNFLLINDLLLIINADE